MIAFDCYAIAISSMSARHFSPSLSPSSKAKSFPESVPMRSPQDLSTGDISSAAPAPRSSQISSCPDPEGPTSPNVS